MAKKTDKKVIFKKEKEMPSLAVSFYSMEFNKTGIWRNFRPVINYDKCTFCAICWKFCPEVAIKLEKIKEKGKEKFKPLIDYEYCKGCLICREECPVGAIEIEEEAE
jgi:2-oxoacid:acceptor oxidoreductase delta subunit (pyruvate/2-ketoisovalerate family)